MRVSDLSIDRVYINQMSRDADYQIVDNHSHCYYELFFVKQGRVRFFINSSRYDLNSGEFLIIPPKELHFNRYLTQSTRANIYFRNSDIMENGRFFLPDLDKKFLQTRIIRIPNTYLPMFNDIIDAMTHEESIDDDNTATMMQLLLKQLFVYCNRHCSFRDNNLTFESDVSEDILDAIQYINEHFNQPITLEQLAAMVNLSPSYFSKKFYQTLGIGMKKYLNFSRLRHAALELASTEHSITEIAINCGFSDGNYFKDAFKKAYNISPRAYRKSRAEEYSLERPIINERYLRQHPELQSPT